MCKVIALSNEVLEFLVLFVLILEKSYALYFWEMAKICIISKHSYVYLYEQCELLAVNFWDWLCIFLGFLRQIMDSEFQDRKLQENLIQASYLITLSLRLLFVHYLHTVYNITARFFVTSMIGVPHTLPRQKTENGRIKKHTQNNYLCLWHKW